MQLLKQFQIAILFLALCSCGTRRQEQFVDKYADADFTAFINKCVYFRGRDKEQLLILFVDNDLSEEKNDGPFIVYVDEDSKKVVKTSTVLMKDTININKTSLERLAIHFLSYHVRSLKVDTNGNVFIGLLNEEKPDLIRFSDEKYRTGFYKEGWSKVKGNWYRMNQ
ncbi:hypothetical protein ACTJJ0_21310 [Chitinophaga sp. 22321]|uniref:Lipoprotein n=1 Tax=Chitinophaga hostae TaxID=2831022 RepID=A0ABS5J6E5_9BACT|nr:hypothetical protein [Chitinophaga hostae]MBS0030027.1 hypothetical protein [Chitinophaga hostae]